MHDKKDSMPNKPLTIEEAIGKIQGTTPSATSSSPAKPLSIDEAIQKIQSTPTQQGKKGGLIQSAGNLVRDITAPAATLLTRPYQLGVELGTRTQEALTGQKLSPEEAQARQTVNLPFYGEITPSTGVQDVVKDVGRVAQTVSLGIGGPATSAATNLGRVGQYATRGALGGGLYAGGEQVAETGEVSGETLSRTAKGAVTGGLIGGALGRFAGKAPQGTSSLQRSAEAQIGRVLAPTTKVNKQITQKIAPEVLSRRITAVSDDDLLRQARAGKEGALEALSEAYDSLPAGTKVDTKPVFLRITEAKNNLVNQTGVLPKSNEAAWKALDDLENELADIVTKGGETIGSIREYRQQLDRVINAAGKGFGYNAKDKAALQAQKEFANAIRSEIAKQNPSIDKVNKDFTFWSRLLDVLEAKAERQTGQTGFTKTLGTVTGGAVGGATGGVGGAITSAIAVRTLIDFMKSTAWNSFSAIQKARLAELISKGKFNDAIKLMEKAGAPIRKSTQILPVAGVEALSPDQK